mgnify:FL=1
MKSYLKFLSRNKLYTAIEAVGLVISIAFVILIGNYVWQQYSIAHENPIGDRVYAVGNGQYVALSWWDKAEFDAKIPEAEAVCRVSSRDMVITIGESKVQGIMIQVDPEFFEIFPNYQLLEGNLEEYGLKGHCLISESFARKHFTGSPIGKQLSMENYFAGEETFTVCGVYKDFSGTMMPPSDILSNPEYDAAYSSGRIHPFSTIGQYVTLIKVKEGTDREALAKKVEDICKEHYDSNFVKSTPIYTVPELYFNPEQWIFHRGNKSVLQMLLVVVLLLLASAIFNYVNLSLALSGKRAKEMATRRLLGAPQGSIIWKYIGESILFTAVCFALALLLSWALLPIMNELLLNVTTDTGNTWMYIPVTLGLSAGTVAAYALAIVLIGALAGIAPALFASRFAPIDIVRGTFRRRSKMMFSKVFIVFQNTVSVILIAMAILMEAQLGHMMHRPLNARSEGLYFLGFYARDYSEVEPLVDRLNRIPEVKRVAFGRGFPGQMNMELGFKAPDGTHHQTQVIACTPEYFEMLGLKVVKDFGTPRENSVWMSQSLANEIELSDTTMTYYAGKFQVNGINTEYVGGVFEDIPTSDATASDPTTNSAIIMAPAQSILYGNGLMIEVEGDKRTADKAIMEAYAAYSEEKNGTYVEPGQNGYIMDVINRQLLPVKMALRLVELFMVLSVLIALLGLLAMSAYYSGENTKSIAVRKVFGSDVLRETRRTVKDYMVLVGIACIIGIPVSVWMAGKYLSRYTYRIENYWWIFVLAVVLTFAMAFGSVLWQTLKAAKTNPATELKKE